MPVIASARELAACIRMIAVTKPTAPSARLRQIEQEAAIRRVALISEIAALQSDIVQRRASLAADEQFFAKKLAELEAIEKQDYAKAAALSPAKPIYIKTSEAAYLLRCNDTTAKKHGRENGFAWLVGGRYVFCEEGLRAYLAKAS